MSKTISLTNTYRIAFVIDEAFLKRLDELFKKETGKAKYSVKLKNGRSVECENLDDVLNMNNVGDSSITEISVSGWSSHTSLFVIVDNRHVDSVFLRLSTTEKDVDYLQKTIEETLRSTQAPFARYAFLNWWHFVVFMNAVYFSWIIGSHFLQGGSLKISRSPDSSDIFESILHSFVIEAIIYTIASLLTWVVRKLYPIGSFLIGNGKARYQALGKRRTFIFTIFFGILTLLIGYILTLEN